MSELNGMAQRSGEILFSIHEDRIRDLEKASYQIAQNVAIVDVKVTEIGEQIKGFNGNIVGKINGLEDSIENKERRIAKLEIPAARFKFWSKWGGQVMTYGVTVVLGAVALKLFEMIWK